MALRLIPEVVKFLKTVGSIGIKNNLEVLVLEGGCLTNMRPTFDKLLIQNCRWCDRQMITLLLSAVSWSTIEMNLQGKPQRVSYSELFSNKITLISSCSSCNYVIHASNLQFLCLIPPTPAPSEITITMRLPARRSVWSLRKCKFTCLSIKSAVVETTCTSKCCCCFFLTFLKILFYF